MAESVDIQRLKIKKRVAKAGFTRIENFIKAIQPDSVDVEEVRIRLDKLEELQKTLEESLVELAVYDKDISEEQIDLEIAGYEEKYVNLKRAGVRIIQERVKPASTANQDQAIAEIPFERNNVRNRASETQIRLPKIELPTFSGVYEEWHSFFGIFDSLIHSNNLLNEVQKFLNRASETQIRLPKIELPTFSGVYEEWHSFFGEAAEAIESIEITGANYRDAWYRLKERYDNERVAVQKHIKAIFELPALRKENSIALRNLLDGILKHTRALTALKRRVKDWGDLLTYTVSSKLDYFTTKEWEGTLQSKQLPTFQELIEFLTRRCETLETVARRNPSIELNSKSRQTSSKFTTAHAAITVNKCAHCKGEHWIYQCKGFKELSISDRLSRVKALKLCLNCLKDKHIARECTAGNCKRCSKRHSSLLHDDKYSTKEDREEKNNIKSNQQEDGISQQVSSALKSVELHIMSRCSTFNMDIEYVILPKITQNLPLVEVCVTNLDIPKDIKLADPHFNTPSKIDMLIGAEKFWELIGTGQIRLGKYKPVLQESSLGWLISGPISLSQSNKGSSTSCHLSTIDELNQSVKRFWEIEDYTNAKNTDAEEECCERLFKASYKRTTEGRFVVKLPVKEKILPLLENSRKVAVNRFLALERKFARQPEFKAEYVAFMREYQQLGHMRASNISLGNKFRVFLTSCRNKAK
ncbi:PREDICTED: uncharacterized protein LOC108768150 [Trachymyrmex cornetzi]|uniref:uncharacterized protein LOC108768150 n=1 Tax=Trachymyrmex cornetzi TaxID=471704 RepID=UPI00084F3C2D|nr:PREDICTED: uncharacterized protein LOC108768150 [Trachymyrmex cornetzi]